MAASGALNMGLSGTVRIVWLPGNSSSNCRTAGSKLRLLFGNPQPLLRQLALTGAVA